MKSASNGFSRDSANGGWGLVAHSASFCANYPGPPPLFVAGLRPLASFGIVDSFSLVQKERGCPGLYACRPAGAFNVGSLQMRRTQRSTTRGNRIFCTAKSDLTQRRKDAKACAMVPGLLKDNPGTCGEREIAKSHSLRPQCSYLSTGLINETGVLACESTRTM